MEEFLRYLVLNLVGTGQGIALTQHETPQKTVFRLKLPQSEAGKIIGKQGRSIEAIRNVLNAASRHGQKATLQIEED